MHRHGIPILVRTDGAGCSKAFLAHIRGLRAQAILTESTVGWPVTARERAAFDMLPETRATVDAALGGARADSVRTEGTS